MTFTMKHSLIVVAVIGSATALGVLLFIFAFNGNLQYAPTIRLPQGRVRGTVEAVEEGGDGGGGGKVFLYQAVRYATGRRFEKAQLISKIENQENGDDKEPPIYDAIFPRDNCPQLGLDSPEKTYTSTTYSEDCLYLNIWSRMEPKSNRSVMVYFFGGAFMYGSIFEGIHDGRYLAHRGDVIVVTVNYRLNAFGFLGSTSSSSSSAAAAVSNLGLHDQLVGLRWIAENIGHFGGNKDSVTIFGNSAGSMAVSGLLLSPLSAGLFSRAILQSGVLLSPPSVEEALENVAKIAAYVPGCPPEEKNPETLLSGCLRRCSTEELLNATRDSGVSLGPVYGDELLPRRPVDLLLNEEFNSKVQLLFGTVRDEGFGMALGRFPELNNDSQVVNLTFNSTREYIIQLVGPRFGPEAADFYLQRANLSASNSGSLNDFREVINQAYGDFSITCPTFLFGSQFIKPTLGGVLDHYAWLLTRPAAVHIMRACRQGWAAGTVCHADDLFSLFTIAAQRAEADRAVSRAIRDSWASFARSGKMAGEGVVHWPEAAHANGSSFVMALDSTFHLLENVHRETCEHFWRARIFV